LLPAKTGFVSWLAALLTQAMLRCDSKSYCWDADTC
jgi:hypothetical protein